MVLVFVSTWFLTVKGTCTFSHASTTRAEFMVRSSNRNCSHSCAGPGIGATLIRTASFAGS